MPHYHFNLLVTLLRNRLQVDVKMANIQSPAGPIIPEIQLHCLLRWLAGGSYLDICSVSRTSKTLILSLTTSSTSTLTCSNGLLLFTQKVNIYPSTFYYILWEACDAVCDCKQLALHFLTSEADIAKLAAGFCNISYDGVVNGCVGAVAGWLWPIIVPAARFGKVASYFSGHYQQHGLNVQAVYDSLGQFLFITVAAPGCQPDINALKCCDLLEYLRSFPPGYYLIGDNTYQPLEQLLPIFGRVEHRNNDNDNANYYITQCRICIEMTFDVMVQKWALLQRPL
jgi:hypothetical protein